MSVHPKARADLQFAKSNLPKAIEIDYSDDIVEADFENMEKSMMKKFDLDTDELKIALTEGILISGEPW